VNTIIDTIHKAVSKISARRISLMEVCGTHTMAIARAGIRSLVPDAIRLLSGPGCPVCVTPQSTIDYAIALARHEKVLITTFGDMVRVPGSEASLEGFQPRIVYSPLDALEIAVAHPDRDVVFIGVGFETTSPTVAATVLAAEKRGIPNFFVLPAFKCIPPALDFIARSPRIAVDGFILPGHVSAIIGSHPYEFVSEQYDIPGCITGFDPVDILQGILNLLQQISAGEARITIEYRRVVKPEGNTNAQRLLQQVFTVVDSRWRGIGEIERSGLTFNEHYKEFDVGSRYPISVAPVPEPKGCICGSVLLGVKLPHDCALFGDACTPLSPVGPCMVSSEGSCAAYYKYGDGRRHRKKRRRKRSR
jgi:hydrogenase expression/formation protein HypD